MEKGHFGKYTGNARHSRKEEMIHDRELIFDAKKQLHDADKDYKKDSPFEGNAFTKAMADSGGDYDKAKQTLDSPLGNHGGRHDDGSMMGKGSGYVPPNSTSVPKLNTGMGSGNGVNPNGKTNKPKAFGIISIGSDSKPITLGITGVNGATKQNNPMTSARTASASTAATDKSKSTSSYTTLGQGRRERRLGKAERKAELKGSQDKIIAQRRLEKKASRIKNRAFVKGDKGATNQYDTKK